MKKLLPKKFKKLFLKKFQTNMKIWTREEYHKLLGRKMLTEENCPFCGEYLDTDQIIWQWKYWLIMRNKFPYIENGQHIMAMPKIHRKYSREFSNEEWIELWEVHKFVEKFYGNSIYFSFTRENFIPECNDGRSVEHWHIHFLPGILEWRFLRMMLTEQGYTIPWENE